MILTLFPASCYRPEPAALRGRNHRFRRGGPAASRGTWRISVPGRAQRRSAAGRHPVRLEWARPPAELGRADLPRPSGLEFYIGPPRDVQVEADGGETPRPLRRFDSSNQPPVRAISPASPEIYLMESEETDRTRPEPGGSGRPASVLRVAALLRDAPRRPSGRRISASSLRAGSSSPPTVLSTRRSRVTVRSLPQPRSGSTPGHHARWTRRIMRSLSS